MPARTRGILDRPVVARPSRAVASEPRSPAVRTSSSAWFPAQTPIAVFDVRNAVANCDRFGLQTANRDLEQTWTVQAA